MALLFSRVYIVCSGGIMPDCCSSPWHWNIRDGSEKCVPTIVRFANCTQVGFARKWTFLCCTAVAITSIPYRGTLRPIAFGRSIFFSSLLLSTLHNYIRSLNELIPLKRPLYPHLLPRPEIGLTVAHRWFECSILFGDLTIV